MTTCSCSVGNGEPSVNGGHRRTMRRRHGWGMPNPSTNPYLPSGGNHVNISVDQERDPPPPATPPAHPPCSCQHWKPPDSAPDFQALFSQISRPTDIKQNHVDALNVDILPPCSVEEMLPPRPDGTSYLLPPYPIYETQARSYAEAAKSEPRWLSRRLEYERRLAELGVDNDLAFQTISRSLPAGTSRPKLASTRKFWEGLVSMSEYGDCSLDQDHEAPAGMVEEERNAKRPRQHALLGDFDDVNNVSSSEHDSERPLSSPASTPHHLTTHYSAQRTLTGRQMPELFRINTIKAFVESTIWPFQRYTLAPPRRLPVVRFGNLILPVRQTAAIYRLSRDGPNARKGMLDGPVIGLQVRAETDLVDAIGHEAQSRLDLMRELGGLLQIAQQRRRQGEKICKPGQGKWWTSRPRWGGGSGIETAECDVDGVDSVDLAEATADLRDAQDDLRGMRSRHAKRPKRKTPPPSWTDLSCGSGHWDPNTNYEAIGKDPASRYDEVFLISSRNHHIGILKLTVHDAYTEYVTSNAMPSLQPAEVDWCRPRLQRTQWFDLFDLKDRVEAFRALWAVLAYLDRNIPSP